MARWFPDRPRVGVGAVLIHEGRALLIRRGRQPLQGRWSVPGGEVELGESLEAALVREVEEETGLVVRPVELSAVFDRIERDPEGRVAYHFVILDYLCQYVSGTPRAGSDAADVALATQDELPGFDLPDKALVVVLDGFRRVSRGASPATDALPIIRGAC